MKPQLIALFSLLAFLPALTQAQTRPTTNTSGWTKYTLKPNIPTFWIIGDSTVRNGHDGGENGQWGWGHPIASFFDQNKINVVNFALGGTSSRTYQSMGLWDHVLADMKKGDYVIMQFGTNDASAVDDKGFRNRGVLRSNGEEIQEMDNSMTGKHEVVHSFGWYIRKFITDAQAKGAACEIVCSQIP